MMMASVNDEKLGMAMVGGSGQRVFTLYELIGTQTCFKRPSMGLFINYASFIHKKSSNDTKVN